MVEAMAGRVLDADGLAQELEQLLELNPSILFITGAGISADSGLPTYRGVAGLYNEPDAETGLPMEEIMSGDMWQKDPSFLMKHLRKVADACQNAQPNSAHKLIARLEEKLDRVWVLTQNVDGLHQKAGTKKIIEMHGNAMKMDCTAFEEHSWYIRSYDEVGDSPICPQCGSIARPAVVLFGESLPEEAVDLYNEEVIDKGFDVVVSIGTSHMFHYISAPVLLANENNATTVDINPSATELDYAFKFTVRERAAQAAETIAKRLGEAL